MVGTRALLAVIALTWFGAGQAFAQAAPGGVTHGVGPTSSMNTHGSGSTGAMNPGYSGPTSAMTTTNAPLVAAPSPPPPKVPVPVKPPPVPRHP
jgi:hypothetical protein